MNASTCRLQISPSCPLSSKATSELHPGRLVVNSLSWLGRPCLALTWTFAQLQHCHFRCFSCWKANFDMSHVYTCRRFQSHLEYPVLMALGSLVLLTLLLGCLAVEAERPPLCIHGGGYTVISRGPAYETHMNSIISHLLTMMLVADASRHNWHQLGL